MTVFCVDWRISRVRAGRALRTREKAVGGLPKDEDKEESMRRVTRLLAAIAMMAAVVIIPANSQGFRQSRVGQVWGSFVHWPDLGPGKYTALVKINIDGTFIAGAVHGVWEKTGFSTVNFTGLLQQFDAAGNLVGLERHRCYFEYSSDFNSYKGMEFAETVKCPTPLTCPNPLDPTIKWTPAQWTGPNGVPVTGARIEVLAPGPLK
jgi:hypothetical protein